MPTSPPSRSRAAFKPTKSQHEMVWALVVADTPVSKIAGVLGISDPTLRQHFGHELDNAKAEMDALALRTLRRARKTGKG